MIAREHTLQKGRQMEQGRFGVELVHTNRYVDTAKLIGALLQIETSSEAARDGRKSRICQ